MAEKVVLRFDDVSFEYVHKKPILKDASFSVRSGSKITLMGQNGAGKSTLFSLIKGENKPKDGKIFIDSDATVATAKQVIPREDLDLTVEEYYKSAFEVAPTDYRSKIAKVMEAVNLQVKTDLPVRALSGGQQARLLLSHALIQEPDILLLDEPTNNLDEEGINHLIEFLIMYQNTVIVISHDADFLNCFTEGVIYLDVHTKEIETYVGDYYSVCEEIERRIEKERMQNARMEKIIKDRKEKVNFFAQKGGKMRKLAKKMKEETYEMEENKVEIRKEDKTIRDFEIPVQEEINGDLVTIKSVKIIRNHEPKDVPVELVLRKKSRLLISGPNGIGKSTLLKTLVASENPDVHIDKKVKLGYYSQDFSNLNHDDTVFESLQSACTTGVDEQYMRMIAAGFLLTGEFMGTKVSDLSEGQKGLLAFARLVLMKPGLLIMDEPTNHINFRHIPIIAKAINAYQGPIILVSHMNEFINDVKVNEYLDLGKFTD